MPFWGVIIVVVSLVSLQSYAKNTSEAIVLRVQSSDCQTCSAWERTLKTQGIVKETSDASTFVGHHKIQVDNRLRDIRVELVRGNTDPRYPTLEVLDSGRSAFRGSTREFMGRVSYWRRHQADSTLKELFTIVKAILESDPGPTTAPDDQKAALR